jgi:DNA-directed RNA polymerase subunit M/transcription elongation factor TFIIS
MVKYLTEIKELTEKEIIAAWDNEECLKCDNKRCEYSPTRLRIKDERKTK